MSQPLNRSPSPFWRHALLGLALVAAQLLGQVHRAEHGGLPAVAHAHSAAITDAHASAAQEQSAHGTDGPFGHAAGQTEQCRLYDQLALADLLLATAAAELPAVDVASQPAPSANVAPQPAALAGYLARAPPARA